MEYIFVHRPLPQAIKPFRRLAKADSSVGGLLSYKGKQVGGFIASADTQRMKGGGVRVVVPFLHVDTALAPPEVEQAVFALFFALGLALKGDVLALNGFPLSQRVANRWVKLGAEERREKDKQADMVFTRRTMAKRLRAVVGNAGGGS